MRTATLVINYVVGFFILAGFLSALSEWVAENVDALIGLLIMLSAIVVNLIFAHTVKIVGDLPKADLMKKIAELEAQIHIAPAPEKEV